MIGPHWDSDFQFSLLRIQMQHNVLAALVALDADADLVSSNKLQNEPIANWAAGYLSMLQRPDLFMVLSLF
jgi:hypothetical protein